MARLAVIGGTGLNQMAGVECLEVTRVETPYGACSSPLARLVLGRRSFYFLPRHGRPHRIPPHRINYRANLWALREAGVDRVLAINAVGGMGPAMGAGVVAVPKQLVDYTWGREHTYFDGGFDGGFDGAGADAPSPLQHVDFTHPYTPDLRRLLLAAAGRAGEPVVDGGVYGATQGPRLESAAEIRRLVSDGCDLVGMTGMPEAGLARELGMDYASLCLVVNPAAGEGAGEITMADIERVLAAGMQRIHAILAAAIENCGTPL